MRAAEAKDFALDRLHLATAVSLPDRARGRHYGRYPADRTARRRRRSFQRERLAANSWRHLLYFPSVRVK